MPLVFGLNFYRFKPVYTPNSGGRVYQLFGVFKSYAIARIDLKSRKRSKLINFDGLFDAKSLVFWGDGTGNNAVSSIRFRSSGHGLAGKGGVIAVTVNNPSRNYWPI